MIERGTVRLNIERGATISEFQAFLDDLEGAYLAVYSLPNWRDWRHRWREFPFPREIFEDSFITHLRSDVWRSPRESILPPDQLEISSIKIESPGFIELLASFNPLQQLREYLKDRHERIKDRDWRGDTEKAKALIELDILRAQADRERIGVIADFSKVLDEMRISKDERDAILWERLGVPLSKLARHQDSGLLGSQNEDIDGRRGG